MLRCVLTLTLVLCGGCDNLLLPTEPATYLRADAETALDATTGRSRPVTRPSVVESVERSSDYLYTKITLHDPVSVYTGVGAKFGSGYYRSCHILPGERACVMGGGEFIPVISTRDPVCVVWVGGNHWGLSNASWVNLECF